MAFTTGFDVSVPVEFASRSYVASFAGVLTPFSIDMSFIFSLVEFSTRNYVSNQSGFTKSNGFLLVLPDLLYSTRTYVEGNPIVSFNKTRQSLELTPVILPAFKGTGNPAWTLGFLITWMAEIGVYKAPPHIARKTYQGDIELTQVSGLFGPTMVGADLERDGGLQTAILISLYTDRRVAGTPSGDRGWWADNDMGSSLWAYDRSKITEALLSSIAQDFVDALKWLVTDGVAKSVNAQALHYDTNEVRVDVKITLPYYRNNYRFFTFYYNVQNQLLRY